jgi:hypothetical protein
VRVVQAQVTSQPTSTANTNSTTVQTPLGTVQLENAPTLAQGARLTLAVVQTLPPAAGALLETGAPADIAELAGGWQSVSDILNTLAQIDPDAAAHFARMTMPASAFGETPTANNLYPSAQDFSSGLSLFMNALSGGDFRGWVGARAAQMLADHGHEALLTQAEAEFGAMRGLYADAKQQNWQALFLPLMLEGQVKTLRLYTKRERKKDQNKKSPSGTRFIMELELSQTGPLQLDGLVKKRDGATQFDLMIRSRLQFDAEVQRDIQQIYASIGEATGYKGMVLFQQVNEFPVKPLEEILAQQRREVTA